MITAENLDDLRDTIIEEKIDTLLREGHVSQVEEFLKRVKIDPPDPELLKDFGEICERRNIVTHANGIVNKRYRERLLQLKFKDADIPKIGEEIDISSQYIMRSNGRVSLLGFWLIHSIWRKILPAEKKESNSAIVTWSHEMLSAGFTKFAGRICRLALDSFPDMPDVDRAYLVINLALSYHLNNDLSESERKKGVEDALSLRQWDIVNGKFALAICCLREEFDDLAQKIDGGIADGVNVHNFMEWALFSKIRDRPEFIFKMRDHFDVDLTEPLDIDDEIAEMEQLL